MSGKQPRYNYKVGQPETKHNNTSCEDRRLLPSGSWQILESKTDCFGNE